MYYGGYRMSQEDQQIKNREANREVYQHAMMNIMHYEI